MKQPDLEHSMYDAKCKELFKASPEICRMMDGDMPALIKTITRLYDENQRLKKVIDDSLDPEKIYKILHDGTVYPCLPNRIMEVVAQELSFELKKELDLGGKDE